MFNGIAKDKDEQSGIQVLKVLQQLLSDNTLNGFACNYTKLSSVFMCKNVFKCELFLSTESGAVWKLTSLLLERSY